MKKQEFYLKDIIITAESEVYDGEILDTEIYLNDTFLFCIAGSEIKDFVNDIENLMNKYRI